MLNLFKKPKEKKVVGKMTFIFKEMDDPDALEVHAFTTVEPAFKYRCKNALTNAIENRYAEDF